MKTLYISDLDGTLLDRNAEITEYTRNAVNMFTKSGGHFTIATARTSETIRHIMSGVKLNVPMMLMNGVFALDPINGNFVMSRFIDIESTLSLIDIKERLGLSGFLYIGENDHVSTYYTQLETEHSKAFKEERERKYNKKFTHIADLKATDVERAVYFSVCERKELLDEAAAELKKIDGLNVIYHSDVYDTGLWYLDVCSKHASKKTALEFLRNKYGYEKIVAFGDNYNDLPMFEASDYKIAVKNAVSDIKSAADEVIGSNIENGVARYLESIM